MKKIIAVIAIGLIFCLGFSTGAFSARGGGHGGGFHGGGHAGFHGGVHHIGGPRVFVGGYFGFPYYPYWYYPYGYYYPGYYYPYPYYPYYTYPDGQLPAYTEQEPEYYWYYCQDAHTYYPYVESCPGGWTKVIPSPPAPGKEGATK